MAFISSRKTESNSLLCTKLNLSFLNLLIDLLLLHYSYKPPHQNGYNFSSNSNPGVAIVVGIAV